MKLFYFWLSPFLFISGVCIFPVNYSDLVNKIFVTKERKVPCSLRHTVDLCCREALHLDITCQWCHDFCNYVCNTMWKYLTAMLLVLWMQWTVYNDMSKVLIWYMNSYNTLSFHFILYILSNRWGLWHNFTLYFFLKRKKGYQRKLLVLCVRLTIRC